MRTPYQRDRDRIVHATAFRRLTYKTQVFLFHEGDHYRTRLTHSLEVAQIARTLARLLGLDEDLAEALALAHDLGHPPFGHAGERALVAAMADFGGFDHNAQSFKVVTRLERKYVAFDGLNLTWETLEGIVKHNGPITSAPGDKAKGVLRQTIKKAGMTVPLALDLYAPAEAQAAAIADDIAYCTHDIDDGLRAGLIEIEDLTDVPLAGKFVLEIAPTARADKPRLIYEVNRRSITSMIGDVVAESRNRLDAANIRTVSDVRRAGQPIIAFSPQMRHQLDALRAFLFKRVYHHHRVMRVMRGAETIVSDLFRRYMQSPADMPSPWAAATRSRAARVRAAVIADFVAGMTDRYAIEEHRRLFDATPDLR
jgi:dGTPase